MFADEILKPQPCQPTKEQAEYQNNRDDDGNENRIVGFSDTEDRGNHRKHQLRKPRDKADQQAADMQPFAIDGGRQILRRINGFVHKLSCRIAARMASRIASASAFARPGNATLLLWLPAVCTVSVARP